MSFENTCGECGQVIPADSPEGYCGQCLLRLGLERPEERPAALAVGPGFAPATAFVGTQVHYFGDYELLEEIARGGMGVVYKARQISLNRLVALKLISAGALATDELVKRFQAEAEAAASLAHPNIVPIYEIGEHQGQHYFSMGLIEGPNLRTALSEIRARRSQSGNRSEPRHLGYEPRQAARLVATIARAVHYAHQRGILHRDLKPGNVLLDDCGEPHITDFGLAKLMDDDSSLTLSGIVMGTPSYMSPEQAAGHNRQLTTASDLWSLGAILYELLMGQPAFRGTTPVETMRQVMNQEPKRPSTLNPAVDRDLETIALKCLEKDPLCRYASAAALADDLEHWLRHEPILARRSSVVERVVKWAWRQPALAAFVVALHLVLALGLGGILWQWRRADEAHREATRSNEQLRRALNQMDSIQLQRAEEYMAEERRIDALPRWALVLRNNPSNRIAAERLMSTLSHRSWARLACPPLEHSNRITLAVFSRDGTRVTTSSADRTAWVWDAATGRRVAGPFIHEAEINTSVFSFDGRFVVTASQDKTARIWNAVTGEPVGRPLSHDAEVSSAQFNPVGTLVLTTSGSVGQLWNVATGEREGPALAGGSEVRDARFSPDGLRVAMACKGGYVQVWEPATGNCLHRFDHAGDVWSAAFSPDGNRLVTASAGKTARLWDVKTGQPVGEPLHHLDRVWGAEFSPDGQRIVTASFDGTAQIWDARTGQKIGPPLKHDAGVRSALFSPEGLRVVTASHDKTVRVWDALTGEPLTEPLVQEASAFYAVFDPRGERVLTASNGKCAMVWDITPAPALKIWGQLAHAWAGAFSPDGGQIVVGSDHAGAGLYGTLTGAKSKTLATAVAGPDYPSVDCVEFHPNDNTVLVGDLAGRAVVWDSATGQPLTPVRALHAKPLVSARFSHDGRLFLTASWDGGVRVCDARTGDVLAGPLVHPNELTEAEFSPDDQWLLTTAFNSVARIWEVATGRIVREFRHDARINSAHFSPDGRRVLTASSDLTARVWDARGGELLGMLPHANVVHSARFSPDGTRIVTAHRGYAHTLQLWDAETFKPLTEPFGEGSSAEFDSSGQRLIEAALPGDKQVRVWDARTGARLSEDLLKPEPCRFSHFSPDGRFILFATYQNVQIQEAPPAHLPVPDWLPELAEALAGQQFSGEGLLEPVRPSELWAVQQKMAAWGGARIPRAFVGVAPTTSSAQTVAPGGMSEGGESGVAPDSTRETRALGDHFYSRWARWFLADASTRTVFPSSPLTLPAYAARLSEQDRFESSCEALRLQPANGLIMASLARQCLPSEGRTAPHAEWLAVRATELAPGHAVTWWTYADWLLAANRCEEAVRMMKRAEPLVSNSPKFYNDQAAMMARCGQWENALASLTKSLELISRSTNGKAGLRGDALRLRSEVLRHFGREAEAHYLEVSGIPPRPSDADEHSIDLSAHYNIGLDARPEWSGMPRGMQTLAGVRFDIRGWVQLIGIPSQQLLGLPSRQPATPVKDIRVSRKCHRLHFLQGSGPPVPDGTLIARYVIHYTDGEQAELPVVYGEEVRDEVTARDPLPTAGRAVTVWANDHERRLYCRTWQNPRPEVEVASLDFIPCDVRCEPFLVALTAEP